ncbi:MAG: hypothetical protein LBR32_09010 [Propionibacteriaceae bacterium]|jgi:hypothetical protein|nr:hypothetical protein [Propionibacteriaceae bacterium]
MGWVKKAAVLLVVAFLVYVVVAHPQTAADAVHAVQEWAGNVGTFFESVLE